MIKQKNSYKITLLTMIIIIQRKEEQEMTLNIIAWSSVFYFYNMILNDFA